MRVLVCGSRHFNDYERLEEVLNDISLRGDLTHRISTIIEGEARGADTLARRYGERHGIDVEKYPANWELYGKRAGPIRNSRMLKEGAPELVVAFLAKDSRGTQNMIDQSKKAGVETIIVDISPEMPLGSPRKAVDAFK